MPIAIVKAALEATKSAVDGVVVKEAQAKAALEATKSAMEKLKPGQPFAMEEAEVWGGTDVRKEAITKAIRIIEALKASLKAL